MKTENLLRVISTGLILQFINAVLSIVKVPIIIYSLGPTAFIEISVFIAFWSYLTFKSEANRKNSRNHFAKSGLWVESRGIKIGLLPLGFMALLMILKFNTSFTFLALFAFITAMGIASAISIATANSIGVLEASGRISLVNRYMILNQLITFPLFLFATYAGNTFFVLLCYLLSYIGGGVIILFYTNCIFPKKDRAYVESKNKVWLEIVFWELLPSALFPYIVSISCNEGEVLKYLIYQKFVIVYAALPVALGPFNAIIEFRENQLSLRKRIVIINYVFVAGCGLLLLTFHDFFITLLSRSAIESDFKVLLALIFSGSLGVFLSAGINRATTGSFLRMRLLSLRVCTVLCLAGLFLATSKFGPSMPFFASALLVTMNYLAISSVRTKKWK